MRLLIVLRCCYFFFFSSRRRHTRLTCDWSSDVCSSDLVLRRGFAEFLHQDTAGRSEFLISHGIGDGVRRGEARVRLLSTQGSWLGVTYTDDRPRVETALRQLVDAGEYPERLWP